jgi:hypothetical protein
MLVQAGYWWIRRIRTSHYDWLAANRLAYDWLAVNRLAYDWLAVDRRAYDQLAVDQCDWDGPGQVIQQDWRSDLWLICPRAYA